GSGRLLFDLVKYSRVQEAQAKSKIIFLGDPAQLPPIGMNFSPALDPEYLTNRYQVTVSMIEMKEVKRQNSTNGILLSATRIRRCLTSGYFNHFDFRGNKEHQYSLPYHDFLSSYKAVSDQKVIICYKNK